MRFTKLHGTGNDFLVVDGTTHDRDWSACASQMLDRHFGVGADGLLVVQKATQAQVRMREFNPDGSEAEMSGNGIRCFAKYVLEREMVNGQLDPLLVETGSGVRSIEPHWEDGQVTRVRVDMGAPVLKWRDIPVNTYEAGPKDKRQIDQEMLQDLGLLPDIMFFDGRLLLQGRGLVVTAVSMGNPHAVHFTDTPVAEYPLAEVGSEVEYNLAFPHRVNFHVVNVLGPDRLASRTWERGVGETLACGTGACAILVAARLHSYVGDRVTVVVPGGELDISWPGHGQVFMEGPVVEVFSGEWPE